MWCFIKDIGFLSVVKHEGETDDLLVRARARAHLERAFPSAEIVESSIADYRFRARVRRSDFIELMLDAVTDIDYESHVKEEVSDQDRDLYSAMLQCWDAMYNYQARTEHAADSDPQEDPQEAEAQAGITIPSENRALTQEEAELMFQAVDEARAISESELDAIEAEDARWKSIEKRDAQ